MVQKIRYATGQCNQFSHAISILLGPYRSAARKNLSSHICPSSKFDEFLAVRSQFGSDLGVDFYAPTCCFLHFIVLCFLLNKIISNVAFRHRCDVYAAVFALDVATLDGKTVDAELWECRSHRRLRADQVGSGGLCKRPSGVRGGAPEQKICE